MVIDLCAFGYKLNALYILYNFRTPTDYNISSANPDSSSTVDVDNMRRAELSTGTPSNTLEPSVSNARQNFYAQNFGMVS